MPWKTINRRREVRVSYDPQSDTSRPFPRLRRPAGGGPSLRRLRETPTRTDSSEQRGVWCRGSGSGTDPGWTRVGSILKDPFHSKGEAREGLCDLPPTRKDPI